MGGRGHGPDQATLGLIPDLDRSRALPANSY
jgi:hypothetical protein